MSALGQLYDKFYSLLCGTYPHYRPWHFQWLFLREVHAWQHKQMMQMKGIVIDVGCGEKPYAGWINKEQVILYIGIDVSVGEKIDIQISSNGCWPFPDNSVDAILITQVLEHVENIEVMIDELRRVLVKDGLIIVTIPFLFPSHGQPHDYRRLTTNGISRLFDQGFEIIENKSLGGAGTTLATLLLTWIETATNSTFSTRILKGVLLPLWIPFSLIINCFGVLVDKIDRTDTHYANVCMTANKK